MFAVTLTVYMIFALRLLAVIKLPFNAEVAAGDQLKSVGEPVAVIVAAPVAAPLQLIVWVGEERFKVGSAGGLKGGVVND